MPNHKTEDGEMQKLAIAVVTAAVLLGSVFVVDAAKVGQQVTPPDDISVEVSRGSDLGWAKSMLFVLGKHSFEIWNFVVKSVLSGKDWDDIEPTLKSVYENMVASYRMSLASHDDGTVDNIEVMADFEKVIMDSFQDHPS